MDTVEEFLAYAINLEREAAERFGMLADAMDAAGNADVARLFRRLGDYSRLHLMDAQARSGYREIPDLKPDQLVWPDFESPESAAAWALDPMIDRGSALQVARDAEQAGLNYYHHIWSTTDDPEIRTFAKEFASEEKMHVAELDRWIDAHKSGRPLPTDIRLQPISGA